MKRIPFLLFLLLICYSCERPDINTLITNQETKGNLTLSVFQIEQTPFEDFTRTEIASTICTHLNFAIYNGNGTRVKQINQLQGDKDFGKVSIMLDEGDYQILVVGHSSNGNPTMTNLEKIQFTNATGYTDTFYNFQTITIGEESKKLSITLLRNVALCRFVIEDNYPQDVKKMQFEYKGGSGAFNATTGLGSVNSIQKMTFDVTSGQKEFDLYTFLHDKKGTVHLRAIALDAAGSELYEREFDVDLEQNIITRFTGHYFEGTSPDNPYIEIDVKAAWAGDELRTY